MKAMRKNYKQILLAIAILTIPAFVWWGAGTASHTGKTAGYAGQIENWKVGLEEYAVVRESMEQRLSEIFGNRVPSNILEDLTWTRLLLLHEAKKRKIQITNQQVMDRIAALPHFQKEGQFDPAGYQRALGNRARQFEEQIRRELILEQLHNVVTASVTATDEEIRQAYTQDNQKIQLGYKLIEIPTPSSTAESTQTTPELTQATENQEKTDHQTQQLRESAKKTAEQMRQEIQQKVSEGTPIQSAFLSLFSDVIQTEPIGRQATLEKIGYHPGLVEKAFQTQEGQLGEVIEVPQGYVLFWVEKQIPIDEEKFKTEKSTYSERILQQKKSDTFNQWLTELKNKTAIKNYLANLKN